MSGRPLGAEGRWVARADACMAAEPGSVKWKKLRCREVLPTGDGAVFKRDLGQSVAFDWTWEGATAFRPADLDAIPTLGDDSDEGNWAVWSGEVVEVDETKGVIFVWVADPDRPPTKGAFYVRPFEFLAVKGKTYLWESHPSGLKEVLKKKRCPPTN